MPVSTLHVKTTTTRKKGQQATERPDGELAEPLVKPMLLHYENQQHTARGKHIREFTPPKPSPRPLFCGVFRGVRLFALVAVALTIVPLPDTITITPIWPLTVAVFYFTALAFISHTAKPQTTGRVGTMGRNVLGSFLASRRSWRPMYSDSNTGL